MAALGGQENLQFADFFFEHLGKQRGVGPRPATNGLDQGRLQFGQAMPAIGLDGHHGNAQPALQMPQFQLDAPAGGHVEHVHRHDGGQPQFQDLADEVQMPLEVRGIDDAEHDVDRPDVGLPLQEHLDGDHFVARSGRQAIKSRQIDQFEPPPLLLHPPGLLFDRDARIVADVLVDSHQGAEERRFARVRIADQGNRQRRFLEGGRHVLKQQSPSGIGTTEMLNPSSARKQILLPAMRIMQGFPRRNISMQVPPRKPNSSKRWTWSGGP